MPYDGLVLSAVAIDLNQRLAGGRIERVYQPEKEKIILILHNNGKRFRLLISAHATNARIHLTNASYKNPLTPPLFCMVLRKHIEGGRISSFKQPGLERILKINISTNDELGRNLEKTLICEIMGKHSNLILVDTSDNTIIDGIKRYSHIVSRHREVLPGRIYVQPPKQNKYNPLLLCEEEFRKACLSRPLDNRLPEVLFAFLEGFSPLTCREIVYRTGLNMEYPLELCGDYELRKLWESLQSVVSHVQKGIFHPTLVTDDNNTPLEFAALDLSHYSVPGKNLYREQKEINAVVDQYYQHKESINKVRQMRQNLNQLVSTQIKRLQKRLLEQSGDCEKAEKADKYREWGELILANLHRIKKEKGKQKIVLESLYTPGKQVTVELNPSLEPVHNAEKFFKRYQKAKTARIMLKERINQSKQELDYLQSIEIALQESSKLTELEEIKQELADGNYLKKGREKTKKRLGIPSPAAFISSDGYTILVGKNNRQNDYLTLKIAGPEDIWLHTKDIPGAHVVIKTGSRTGNIPDSTLVEAAQLAAYNSKARFSQNVPVDYTQKKFVTKPKGSRPGMVIYRNHKTITVNPENIESRCNH